jgi:hypothetical protein
MKQTFKKNINSRLLQFNRLLYPVRCTIKLEDEINSGKQYIFEKDNSTGWQFSEQEVPQWLDPIIPNVVEIIEENENRRFSI